jgi:hypothetical protein
MEVRSIAIIEKLKSGELKPAAFLLDLIAKTTYDPSKKEDVANEVCKELFEALEGSEVDVKDLIKGLVGHLLNVAGTVKATEKKVTEAAKSFLSNLLCRGQALG